MVYGTRSCAPLGVGFAVGFVVCLMISSSMVFPLLNTSIDGYSLCRNHVKRSVKTYTDVAGPWKVNVKKVSVIPAANPNDAASNAKVVFFYQVSIKLFVFLFFCVG